MCSRVKGARYSISWAPLASTLCQRSKSKGVNLSLVCFSGKLYLAAKYFRCLLPIFEHHHIKSDYIHLEFQRPRHCSRLVLFTPRLSLDTLSPFSAVEIYPPILDHTS